MTAMREIATRPPRANHPASSSNCSTSSSASSGAPPPAMPRSWAGPTYSRRYSTRAALRGLALDRAQRHDTTGCTGLSRSLKPWFVQTQTPARGSRPRSCAPLSALAASLRLRGDARSWWEGIVDLAAIFAAAPLRASSLFDGHAAGGLIGMNFWRCLGDSPLRHWAEPPAKPCRFLTACNGSGSAGGKIPLPNPCEKEA